MKAGRIIWIVLLIGALGAGGYFGYRWYFSQSKSAKLGDFVPGKSIMVVEVCGGLEAYEEAQSHDVLSSFLDLSFAKEIKSGLEAFGEALSYNNSEIGSFFGADNQLMITLQSKSTSLVPLVLLEVTDEQASLIENLYANATSPKKDINSKDALIHILEHDSLSGSLHFCVKEGIFFASFDGDVLAQALKGNSKSQFQQDFAEVQKSEAISDNLHIYVNYELAVDYYSDLLRGDHDNMVKGIADFGFVDIHVEDDRFNIFGYSYSADTLPSLLNSFQGQAPGYLEVRDYVSTKTALLYYWGFDNYRKLNESLDSYWYSNYDNHEERRQNEFEELYGADLEQFNSLIGGEVALSILEVKDGYHDKITYVKSPEPIEFIEQLNRVSLKISGKDSVEYEQYGNIKIHRHPVTELPELLFGSHFIGYNDCYYARLGDYILIANSSAAIKIVITDISVDNVWGKSVAINGFLEDSFEQANIGVFVNMSKSWSSVLENCSNEALPQIKEAKSDFDRVEMLSLTFVNEGIENKIYTSGAIKLKQEEGPLESVQEDTSKELLTRVELGVDIFKGPFHVINHNDKNSEFVIFKQDSTMDLLKANGKVLWSVELDGLPISDVEQIDLYRNGKLQYLFATAKKVYCIDRTGKNVENYPYTLPNKNKIETVSVIDYDGSRKYRVVATDTTGGIFVFNVEGENLKGWQPNQLKSKVGNPVSHIRVRGKDFIVALEKKGVLNLFNRRGKMIDDFPIPLSGMCSLNPVIAEVNSSLRSSYMHILTDAGEYYKVNFDGQIKSNELVKKPDPGTKILLLPGEKEPVIAVLSSQKVRVLNIKMEMLYEVKESGVTGIQTVATKWGQVLVFKKAGSGEFVLYDSKGTKLLKESIPGSGQVSVLYSTKTQIFTVYSVTADKLNITAFQK